MGCGCGKKRERGTAKPVDASAPNPNSNEELDDNDAWWQAAPKEKLPPTAATPMPA